MGTKRPPKGLYVPGKLAQGKKRGKIFKEVKQENERVKKRAKRTLKKGKRRKKERGCDGVRQETFVTTGQKGSAFLVTENLSMERKGGREGGTGDVLLRPGLRFPPKTRELFGGKKRKK